MIILLKFRYLRHQWREIGFVWLVFCFFPPIVHICRSLPFYVIIVIFLCFVCDPAITHTTPFWTTVFYPITDANHYVVVYSDQLNWYMYTHILLTHGVKFPEHTSWLWRYKENRSVCVCVAIWFSASFYFTYIKLSSMLNLLKGLCFGETKTRLVLHESFAILCFFF